MNAEYPFIAIAPRFTSIQFYKCVNSLNNIKYLKKKDNLEGVNVEHLFQIMTHNFDGCLFLRKYQLLLDYFKISNHLQYIDM